MTSAHVIDVTLANFEESVIRGSAQRPVLLDFMAPRSEPCLAMAALLETITEEFDGALLLAKVDVEQNMEIAQAFRLQDVPTVILMRDGQPADAFAGYKSEEELRAFLATHIQAPVGGSPLEQAKELAAADELASAIGLLAEWIEHNPEDGEARAHLGTWLLEAGDEEGAREHLALLSEEDLELPATKTLLARLELLAGAGDVEALRKTVEGNPRDVAARIELGKALVASGQTEDGLEELLEAAMRDLQFEDGAARKALIEVFL
ncbi:MAG: putative thioredoxin, partial [Candidatus Paceibacteria bacterium]